MSEKKLFKDPLTPTTEQEYAPLGSALTRIYWMAIGHVLIGIIAYLIASGKSLVIVNSAYFLLVALVIIVRLIDIKVYKGQTSEGDPATMSHWKRFSAIVIGYSVLLWVAAILVARFKLL